MPLIEDASEPAPPYKTFRCRRSLRLAGFDYGQPRPYHVTWGSHRRRRDLTRPALACAVIDILEEEASRTRVTVLTHCLMPDHIHLLVCPEAGGDVLSFIQGFKGKTTRAHWRLGGKGKLWQRGFYDHILRKEEDLERMARYILGNPVRAGLADDSTRYRFSGSLLNPL